MPFLIKAPWHFRSAMQSRPRQGTLRKAENTPLKLSHRPSEARGWLLIPRMTQPREHLSPSGPVSRHELASPKPRPAKSLARVPGTLLTNAQEKWPSAALAFRETVRPQARA